MTERSGPRRVDGLFRTDAEGRHLTLVAVVRRDERIDTFFALPDRSVLIVVVTYQGTMIVGHHIMAVGPMADFLTSGWAPLLDSSRADFGFHRLPGPPPADHCSPGLERADGTEDGTIT
ncbi:MAG: hypothetical protein IRY92_11075 [Dactylosporangium sp.]|nr:hypothetical protein [Dactylosporangium sp.]